MSLLSSLFLLADQGAWAAPEYGFFSGPTFFFSLMGACLIMVIVGAVVDYLPEKEKKPASDDDSSGPMTAAEKRKAKLEAKSRKKLEQASKKKAKASAKKPKKSKGKGKAAAVLVAGENADAAVEDDAKDAAGSSEGQEETGDEPSFEPDAQGSEAAEESFDFDDTPSSEGFNDDDDFTMDFKPDD